MGFSSNLISTLSTPSPWLAGIMSQGIIKTISGGPPDVNRALQTSTLVQGALMAIVYEASKELASMWKV